MKGSRKLNGGDISLLGVLLSVAGTIVATYGARVSSNAATARSDEIAKLSQENAKLSQELAAFATGGNSFFYLHLINFGKPDPEAQIRNVGKYPVRDTQINVFDVTDQFSAIASGSTKEFSLVKEGRKDAFVEIAYPHLTDRILGTYVFETQPTRGAYVYFLYITNATGRFRQIIHLVNVGGTWQQAYIVEKLGEAQPERVIQHFDKEYPIDGERLVRQ